MYKKAVKYLLATLVFSSFYLAMFCALISPLYAQSSSAYTVNDIMITAKGKTPTQARINAIAQAQREALVILCGRLAPDSKFVDNLSTDEISDMVYAQQINNEKIAGNSYSASFNISFSESHINNALDAKNIVQEKSQDQTYLILPVKITKKKTLFWESENDWKSSWGKALKEKNDSRFKLPMSNSEDMALLTPEAIATGNFKELEPILDKYQAEVAIIAYFNFDELENKANITLKTLKRFQNKEVRLGFVNTNHLELPLLLSKVAKKTLDHVIKSIDAESSPKVSANIDILITDLGDWVTIKSKLDSMNFIENMKINSIARDLVQITVVYNRSNGDLISLFAQSKLDLKEKSEGQYFLSAGF